MKRWMFLLGALVTASCAREESAPLVVMIAVDGLTPGTIDELRAQGRLPEIDRLIRRGVWGPMESLAARRRLRPRPRRGYWSPIVWASMATGKVPDKHGIVDFLLPVPGTSFAWIGAEDGEPVGVLHLPELRGSPPHTLTVRVRSYAANGAQTASLAMNGTVIGEMVVDEAWSEHALSVPRGVARPARNTVALRFERQSRPSDHGPSEDHRMIAGALASIVVTDADDNVVAELDPVYHRFSLESGFHQPEAKVVEAGSGHMRAKPLWSVLGERGHPVGVVGYWNTWPAYRVNGFLVSSHMGVRGWRQETSARLTWPPELANDIAALAPDERAMARLTRELYPESCRPIEKLSSFERILWQDAFYFRIARSLLPTMERGFFTVYFESIDGSGHLFLPFADGAPIPEGCPDSVRDVVGKTYERIDAWVGELVNDLPDDAIVMLVSDHGMSPGGERGLHAPFGVFLAAGPGLRGGAVTRGMTILDVAPTILHALGEAVPLDMDGKIGASNFDPAWLQAHPPRYVDVDTSVGGPSPDSPAMTTTDEVSEEMLERLRSLGYLQ